MLRSLLLIGSFFVVLHNIAVAASPLTIGVRNDIRTLESKTTEGKLQGALIDFWKLWAEKNDKEVKFVSICNDSTLALLTDGTIDLVANAKQSSDLSYSDAYFTFDYYLFSLKKSYIQAVEQLPLRIGLLEDHKDFIDIAVLKTARVSYYHSHQEMLEDLFSGDIDYFIANDANLNFSVGDIDLLRLYYPPKVFHQHNIRAAALKSNRQLIAEFNSGVGHISSAEQKEIVSRWSPNLSGYRISWPLIGISLFILFSSALTLIIWLMNLKLKRQVASATEPLTLEKEALQRSEDEAIKRQNNIKHLLDSLRTCIFTLNERGEITHLNKHAEKMIDKGCSSKERSYLSCFPFLYEFEDELQEALKRKESANFYRQKIQVGMQAPMIANIRLQPIEIEDDSQSLLLIDDVTEASQKEELLLQSQKLEVIHSLAGGMAHDFNNILAVISGSAQLLGMTMAKEPGAVSVKTQQYVENINSAVQKATATTKSLATLSGRVSIDLTEFSIQLALQNIIGVCNSTMDKSVSIEYRKSEKDYFIYGNQGLIEQSLLNICINGYHAMTIMKDHQDDQGGVLSVSIKLLNMNDASLKALNLEKEAAEQYIKVCIHDEGVGFTAEQLQQAFTPFYTTKAKGVGSGLGLSMVQNTILQHHGQIAIESEECSGTDVFIYLPCAQVIEGTALPPTEEVSVAAPAKPMNQIKRILLADDNPHILETLAAGLETYGYKVSTVTNGKELLRVYKDNLEQIDLVITDLEMPEMNGDIAFFELKKFAPKAKVIITSGFLEDERVQNVLEAGADGFIQKPCHLKNLVNKITTL